MSDPAFYLWVQETMPRERYNSYSDRYDNKPSSFTWMAPLDAKSVEEARGKAIIMLDQHDLTRTEDNLDYQVKHAIIYEFKENMIGVYKKNKEERQSEIEKKRKQEELKRAEAEVERLKKELGEG